MGNSVVKVGFVVVFHGMVVSLSLMMQNSSASYCVIIILLSSNMVFCVGVGFGS